MLLNCCNFLPKSKKICNNTFDLMHLQLAIRNWQHCSKCLINSHINWVICQTINMWQKLQLLVQVYQLCGMEFNKTWIMFLLFYQSVSHEYVNNDVGNDMNITVPCIKNAKISFRNDTRTGDNAMVIHH